MRPEYVNASKNTFTQYCSLLLRVRQKCQPTGFLVVPLRFRTYRQRWYKCTSWSGVGVLQFLLPFDVKAPGRLLDFPIASLQVGSQSLIRCSSWSFRHCFRRGMLQWPHLACFDSWTEAGIVTCLHHWTSAWPVAMHAQLDNWIYPCQVTAVRWCVTFVSKKSNNSALGKAGPFSADFISGRPNEGRFTPNSNEITKTIA